MGAFIVAGIVFVFGVVAFFTAIALYMSYPAPSVQGNASSPWTWLITCTVLAAIIAATHWMPAINW